jgi:hypothetical protein
MADQLLSQADVDSLIESLSRSTPTPAPTAKPSGTPAPRTPASNTRPAAAAPATPLNTSPAGKTPAAAKPEPKAEINPSVIDSLNSKMAELSKQVEQMSSGLKRLDALEKKMSDLEHKIDGQNPSMVRKVQIMSEQLRKIAGNLKDTPGYGIHHTFSCDACNDRGNVAILFRCTSCGHEKWYGWWPKR